MQHSFDIQEAVDYGVPEAIMIWNLRFWILKNKANGRHLYKDKSHKDKTWTYNTTDAFCKLFPYWSSDQIDRTITRMVEKKIIVIGNFNESAYLKTRWFAFCDEQKILAPHLVIAHFADSRNGNRENAESKPRNKEMDSANTENRNRENAEHTDKNPDPIPIGIETPTPSTNKKWDGVSKQSFDGMTVENFLANLKPQSIDRAKAVCRGWELYHLAEVYLKTLLSRGMPNKGFDAAFPGWCDNATLGTMPGKSLNFKSSKKNQEKAKNPEEINSGASLVQFEETAQIRKAIRIKLQQTSSEWAVGEKLYEKLFAGKEIQKTNLGFTILVTDEKAMECQEILAEINVTIEVKK